MILGEGNACTDGTAGSATPSSGEDDSWTPGLLQTLIIGNHHHQVPFDGCVYRGEGNANIVVALPYERMVVRFRKSGPGEASSDGGRARTEREVEFLKSVISGFLGAYIHTPQLLRCNPEETARLSEAIHPLRPEFRCNKFIVEEYATKYPDYAFLPFSVNPNSMVSKPTFCVEIKPKQGFLHEMDQLFQKCTYCLTQYYKLKSGTISSRSKYCPFDLFSGDTDRMRKALQGLLESPQNNLKIFKDGIVVYDSNSYPGDVEHVFAKWFVASSPGSQEQYFDMFCNLVRTTLLRPLILGQRMMAGSYPHPEICQDFNARSTRVNPDIVAKAKKLLYFSGDECNFTSGNLPRDSVLGRIIRMQQLPYYGADVVYKIYSKHLTMLNDDVMYSKIIEMHKADKEPMERYFPRKQKNSIDGSETPTVEPDSPGSQIGSSRNATVMRNKLQDSNGNKDDKAAIGWMPNDEADVEVENINFPAKPLPILKSRNNNNRHNREVIGRPKSPLTIDQIRALQNYLLAVTAKDCSILMAFQEFDPSTSGIPYERIVKVSERQHFVVNVGVSDLDPKSVHCIEKHRQRDASVLSAVIHVLEEELALRNQLPFEPALISN